MVGVEAFPDTRWGAQLGTFSGLFGPVFNEIHTLTSLPIFIVETNLAPLDGSGYQFLSGFVSDACSHGGDGILQLQNTQTLSGTQWNGTRQGHGRRLRHRHHGRPLTTPAPCLHASPRDPVLPVTLPVKQHGPTAADGGR
jgi:hypothetical protein